MIDTSLLDLIALFAVAGIVNPFKKPKVPDPPDYQAAAEKQGEANLESARLAAVLNRPNEVTPWGSRTWSQDGDQWTSNMTLSPDMRNLHDQQTRIAGELGNVSEAGLGRVGAAMDTPFNMSNIPGRVTNLPGITPGQVGPSGGYSGINTEGLSELPEVSDATRQRVEDALYGRATSRLDPQWDTRDKATQNRLSNMGLTIGSEAWGDVTDSEGRARNDAYNQALYSAIAGGGAEQSRLFDTALSGRAQQFGERTAEAEMGNRASQLQLAEALSRHGADLRGQQATQGAALQGANLANQQRGTAIQEEAYLRNLPLAELNALRTGSQPTLPQFQSYANVGGPAPAPYFDATQQGYMADLDAANAMNAYRGNMMSGLFSLGSAGILR